MKNIFDLQTESNINAVLKSPRSSNLELYRVVCMLMIVAHHFVVNSGVLGKDGPLMGDGWSGKSMFMMFFGAWGKTSINSFMFITGYFMCTSKITLRKFVKLMGQIYLYRWLLFAVFFVAGYETLTPQRLIQLIMPFWNITDGFASCFIAFWFTIPFWTILTQNMNKRQHEILLILVIGIYTVLGSVPSFEVRFNYLTWFGIIFLIASYIRLYPQPIFERKKLWAWMTLFGLVMAMLSIAFMQWRFGCKGAASSYFFLSDSNKIFAVLVAFCSFLWFKNMKIKQSKIINAFGAGTFGVLLIHANSNAMRQWLWKDMIDVVGHYALPLGQLMLFCIGVVLAVFVVCILIDQLRVHLLENPVLRWFDKHLDEKLNEKLNKIMSV